MLRLGRTGGFCFLIKTLNFNFGVEAVQVSLPGRSGSRERGCSRVGGGVSGGRERAGCWELCSEYATVSNSTLIEETT